MDPDIPYLLLTPGPLTTSPAVRATMQRDYCTWDDDYNSIVRGIRSRLVKLATQADPTKLPEFTSVLMQGSGTFSIEAAIGSLIPPTGKLLIVTNGAYGDRMVQIARCLRIAYTDIAFPETEPASPERVNEALLADPNITHIALVHCETTTGMLNPVREIGAVAKNHNKTYMVDAMSSFGGIPIDMSDLQADILVSSSNKCIQGVPGFGFVVVSRRLIEQTQGWARSVSLDLYDQWKTMEEKNGKWRYTSPTHVVRALAEALVELDQEGGVAARHRRYSENQHRLVERMEELGFRTLLPRRNHSPIITSFYYPDDPKFNFETFYQALKRRRFVIYPGKISQAETFRIGNIGHVFLEDIEQLGNAISEVVEELGLRMPPQQTYVSPASASCER